MLHDHDTFDCVFGDRRNYWNHLDRKCHDIISCKSTTLSCFVEWADKWPKLPVRKTNNMGWDTFMFGCKNVTEYQLKYYKVHLEVCKAKLLMKIIWLWKDKEQMLINTVNWTRLFLESNLEIDDICLTNFTAVKHYNVRLLYCYSWHVRYVHAMSGCWITQFISKLQVYEWLKNDSMRHTRHQVGFKVTSLQVIDKWFNATHPPPSWFPHLSFLSLFITLFLPPSLSIYAYNCVSVFVFLLKI